MLTFLTEDFDNSYRIINTVHTAEHTKDLATTPDSQKSVKANAKQFVRHPWHYSFFSVASVSRGQIPIFCETLCACRFKRKYRAK